VTYVKHLSFYQDDSISTKLINWVCLKELGYEFSGIRSLSLPDDVKCRRFLFKNRDKNREVEISHYYSPPLGVGVVFIRNTEKDENIRNSDFVVEDWLDFYADTMNGELSRETYLRLSYLSKETGVEPVLDFLEKLFWGPLKPILTGETWENVPWDNTYK